MLDLGIQLEAGITIYIRHLHDFEGKWLDVGSGLGFESVYLAENGDQVTFIDIVEDNLKSIEGICKIKELH